eukprot:2514069-Prymnesium_polylepis.1
MYTSLQATRSAHRRRLPTLPARKLFGVKLHLRALPSGESSAPSSAVIFGRWNTPSSRMNCGRLLQVGPTLTSRSDGHLLSSSASWSGGHPPRSRMRRLGQPQQAGRPS